MCTVGTLKSVFLFLFLFFFPCYRRYQYNCEPTKKRSVKDRKSVTETPRHCTPLNPLTYIILYFLRSTNTSNIFLQHPAHKILRPKLRLFFVVVVVVVFLSRIQPPTRARNFLLAERRGCFHFFDMKIYCGIYNTKFIARQQKKMLHVLVGLYGRLREIMLSKIHKNINWRIRVSIPVPPACKAGALPFELIPQRA